MNPFDHITSFLCRIPGFSLLSRLSNRFIRNLLAALLALLLLAAIVVAAWILLPKVPWRFWQLLGFCAIALAVLWWFLVGAKRYSRRGFSSKRIGDLGPGNPDEEKLPLERMQQAIAEAKRTIQRSPDMSGGRNALYRIPWLLFLGDEAADVPGLLAAANEASSFPAPSQPAGDPEQVWRWWFSKSMIAIETHPRIVCAATARAERGLWYQALCLLGIERDKLPLNGIVACVSAQTLMAGPEATKATAIRLRRLVDEAMEHLQVKLPVYFVVTGLERLPGYAVYRSALPVEAFDQALGFRLSETEVVNAGSSSRLDELMPPLLDRLHALRLSVLRAQHEAGGRRGAFEFVECFNRLSGSLRQFVGLLLEDNPFQRTPRWRGLFFVGSGTVAGKSGAFVHDLVTRFLPADQPLATPSVKGNAGRMAGAAMGVLVLLGLSAYLSFGLSGARQDDALLLAQTRTACIEQPGIGDAGIAWVADCGRTIEALDSAAANTGLGFGIRRADRDIVELKNKVVERFSRLVLAPQDQMLEADLAGGKAGLEHLLAVAQRLRMLAECRGGGGECLAREASFNVAFDPASRPFSPFLSALEDGNRRERGDALLAAYQGYLRWQDPDTLDEEEKRLASILGRLLAAYRMDPVDVERWAGKRDGGLSLAHFWLPADRARAFDADDLPKVPFAYTSRVWNEALAPMLATLGVAWPTHQGKLDAFRNEYFSRYFQSWALFQSQFAGGFDLWQGDIDPLIRRGAGSENPYSFFFDTARRDFSALPLELTAGNRWSLALAEMRSDWWGAWRPGGRFVGRTVTGWFADGDGVAPPVWLLAMQESIAGPLNEQRTLLEKAYLRLDPAHGGQEAYQIAADLFAGKGNASQPPASEYSQLLAAVANPPEKFAGRFRGDDIRAWSIVQGPAKLLLQLTVWRAARFIDSQWNESVVRPLEELPPKERMAALYGPQGKLDGFVVDWLKPFVTEKDRSPVPVAGTVLPLSAQFRSVLATGRRSMAGDEALMAGTFSFAGPSTAGRLEEGPNGTVFEVECSGRTFRAASNGVSLDQLEVQVLWSPSACTKAVIRIELQEAFTLADVARGMAPQDVDAPVVLSKVYLGADGFVQLMEEFAPGPRSLGVEEFRSSHNPAQWDDLVLQLRSMRFSKVRVNLQVRPSDRWYQYISSREAPARIPPSIIER